MPATRVRIAEERREGSGRGTPGLSIQYLTQGERNFAEFQTWACLSLSGVVAFARGGTRGYGSPFRSGRFLCLRS
jgi:hypothetical protein